MGQCYTTRLKDELEKDIKEPVGRKHTRDLLIQQHKKTIISMVVFLCKNTYILSYKPQPKFL